MAATMVCVGPVVPSLMRVTSSGAETLILREAPCVRCYRALNHKIRIHGERLAVCFSCKNV